MSPEYFKAVFAQNADAARALEYSHVPIQAQLDLGLRQLELDIFYEPTTQRFCGGARAVDRHEQSLRHA